jgi:hypothetical protein
VAEISSPIGSVDMEDRAWTIITLTRTPTSNTASVKLVR